MDSYPGRFPLDFISFYLDMSTEDQHVDDSTQKLNTNNAQSNYTADNPVTGSVGLLMSSLSPDESVTSYIEQTVERLSGRTGEQAPTPPPPPATKEQVDQTTVDNVLKSSVSETLENVPRSNVKFPEPEVAGVALYTDLDSEANCTRANVDFLQKDTSDVRELMDSQATLINPGSETPSHLETASTSKTGVKEVSSANDTSRLRHFQGLVGN